MPVKAAPPPTPVIDAWTFTLTPYLWMTSLAGSTTVKGVTTDVNASFIDILNHTQFTKGLFEAAAFGEARSGRFALLADLAYLRLGIGGSLSRTRGVDRVNGSVGLSAGLTIEMVVAELAAAYEVARWGATHGSFTALDLHAGARAWWQRADAEFQLAGTLNIFNFTATGAGTLIASGQVSWVDPLIGARLRHQFAPGIDLAVGGDIGGFGVGSKLSWQALATLNYEFTRTQQVVWSAMIGYKALSVDYSRGAGLSHYQFDMTIHGPVLGITARF